MMISYRTIALSDHPAARILRRIRRRILDFTLPTPRALVRPVLWSYLALRTVWHFILRVFVAEPLFKAYCKQYGRGVHTGIYLHWIMGRGDIIVGDDVHIDGRCNIGFAARFSDHPRLEIGNHVYISCNCSFSVAKSIRIGDHCYLASQIELFDSPGHPMDPEARKAGMPPPEAKALPITIGDHVWIGMRALIFPGVTIGEGSVIGAGAIVTHDVPPYTFAAGNPARPLKSLLPQNVSTSVTGAHEITPA